MSAGAGILLVKIGGGDGLNLEGIAEDIAAMPGRVVVVHGANGLRDRLATSLGQERRVITSVSGYDSVYSDDAAIDLLMLAYAGLSNTRMVERLQRHGRNAIGLTGLDGRLIGATRNKGVRVRQGDKTLLVRDRSGKPASVNAGLLGLLLEHQYTPVISVPLIDEAGIAVNADNDDVVVALQGVLGAERVIQLIEAPGVLADADDPASVIWRLSLAELDDLETRSTGRFKRKLYALRKLAPLTRVVQVCDGRTAHPLAEALAGGGTIIG